jgi:hypothetical protein
MAGTDVATALAGSFSLLRDAAGVPITYGRGDDNVALVAVAGSTQYAEVQGAGYVETGQTRDFMILAEELKFGNQHVLPERGDTVTEVIDGAEKSYKVVAPGGDRFFNFSDSYRTILRIHCMQET